MHLSFRLLNELCALLGAALEGKGQAREREGEGTRQGKFRAETVAIRAFYVVFKRVKLLQLTDLCVNFYVQFAHPFFLLLVPENSASLCQFAS